MESPVVAPAADDAVAEADAEPYVVADPYVVGGGGGGGDGAV